MFQILEKIICNWAGASFDVIGGIKEKGVEEIIKLRKFIGKVNLKQLNKIVGLEEIFDYKGWLAEENRLMRDYISKFRHYNFCNISFNTLCYQKIIMNGQNYRKSHP